MRKILGGSMRQAGMLAAAGLYALQHHVHRLADDHANATMLSRGLAEAAEANARLRGRFTAHSAKTNIFFTDIDPDIASDLLAYLEAHDIKVKSGVYRGEEGVMRRIRWVTRLDVSREDVERAIKAHTYIRTGSCAEPRVWFQPAYKPTIHSRRTA
ncbi:beta-eliminating lyase-related protein [Burkholderia contaminans]|uniref:beta-eliminating lyase-related protein n=1 Tax=Burkholderia contaminans TaxID=488447 RepID=UPI000699478C|nr:beta-eliminating lyase-related protein [Burkholderia contaminans]MEB4636771.1 beta-eliminating lyase-related protein [Burkholderia contaminans]MEB4651686.1 beta-eliminating lyase-related protein [Burkholderia contaminans]MEB4661257.1 beta-eliminating lyase-related protein [Burkholderia contaminans]MEB4667133.1 beta-eliminating lyase-related protein [Burkholderia contaminans]MEB4678487.1 beta-eliminating lyase-related protein [Burkholderia contaminans]